MKYVKGTLINISNGEYSDYYLMASVRVLKDFDSREALEQFVKLRPELKPICRGHPHKEIVEYKDTNYEYEKRIDHSHFLAWLNAEGYVEDLDITEWHMGCYGAISVPE